MVSLENEAVRPSYKAWGLGLSWDEFRSGSVLVFVVFQNLFLE